MSVLRRHCSTLDGDTCPPHESGCPPQLLQVAIELVPQWHRFWPHVPPQSIMSLAVLQQMFFSHDVCLAWAHVRLTNLLYMRVLSLLCPVLVLNRITCSGLFSLWGFYDWFEFGCCCFHYFLGEGFDDGLFYRYKRYISPLGPAGLFSQQVCLLVHFLGSHSVLEFTAGLSFCGLRGRSGQFPPR